MSGERRRIVNTYRLQLHPGFTFDDAAEVVPHLARLGVTHLYLSPITTAGPGSSHGYDVADPGRLNPELGGEAAYRRLVAAQREHGLGQVVDIVPNHMTIAPDAGNAFWQAVLREGRHAAEADLFDIDWEAGGGQVILPVLGDDPERVVERGELEPDAEAGEFRYFDARYPLSPESLQRWRARGAPRDPASLLALLGEQHYRLAYWRTGKREVNYRRFFEIDHLAGVREEEPRAFEVMHSAVLRLVEEGAIDGLRIDHPDGLRNPRAYLARLAERSGEAWAVVEKILAPDEPLPDAWRCAGTTGYEFMNDLARLMVDPAAETSFTESYAQLAGEHRAYEAIAVAARRSVLDGALHQQFARLGGRLHAAAAKQLDAAEFLHGLFALLAHLEEYRTYHEPARLDPRARAVVGDALERALAADSGPEEALRAAAALLAAPPEGEPREAVLGLQQLMPAVQAKGIEDRAFYQYRRLLALNEVGGEPGRFGSTPAEFHHRTAANARRWPHRMLATATHDHKRGEDARARLAALSEYPQEWREAAGRAFEVLHDDAPGVHPADAYLTLQTAIATLPLGMRTARPDPDPAERVADYAVKALREAGERTSWLDPDEGYESLVAEAARRALAPGSALLAALGTIPREVARTGATNSLSQLLLKLAAPGVVDVYQGNERWDLSLVDPDNRRDPAVDSAADLVESFGDALDEGAGGDAARRHLAPKLLGSWQDGAIKAYVTARGLRFRRAHPGLCLDGTYEPLEVTGAWSDHVVAFARRHGSDVVVALAPRLTRALNRGASEADPWRPDWRDTTVLLPGEDQERGWRDLFTGEHQPPGKQIPLAEALHHFPVALLRAL